jgi:hypothetical protein
MTGKIYLNLKDGSHHPDDITSERLQKKSCTALLHQLALRSNAVEHLQQHGMQKFLRGCGRSAASALSGIHASKETRKMD